MIELAPPALVTLGTRASAWERDATRRLFGGGAPASPVPTTKDTSVTKRRTPAGRPVSGAVPIAGAVLVLVALIGFAWQSGLLPATFRDLASHRRMDDFADAPAAAHDDLLYLTYLDSLWRDELAVPDTAAQNVARVVMERAGIPPQVAARWGLALEDLNALFGRAHELGRLRRPDQRGLLQLIRDRELHAGHVILAQRYPYSHDGTIDFCGILTRTNIMAATSTKILYYDHGRMVHGKLGDVPRIAYFGAVVPGENIVGVYREYLKLAR